MRTYDFGIRFSTGDIGSSNDGTMLSNTPDLFGNWLVQGKSLLSTDLVLVYR